MPFIAEHHTLLLQQLAKQRQLNLQELNQLYELAVQGLAGVKLNIPANRLLRVTSNAAVAVDTNSGLCVHLDGAYLAVSRVFCVESHDPVRNIGSCFIAPDVRVGH